MSTQSLLCRAPRIRRATKKKTKTETEKKKILMPALAYASMLLVPCGSRSISPFAVMQLVQYHSPLGFYACKASHCTFSVRLTACHHDHHHNQNQNQNLPALSTSRKTSRHSRVLTPWQLSAASRTMRCTQYSCTGNAPVAAAAVMAMAPHHQSSLLVNSAKHRGLHQTLVCPTAVADCIADCRVESPLRTVCCLMSAARDLCWMDVRPFSCLQPIIARLSTSVHARRP